MSDAPERYFPPSDLEAVPGNGAEYYAPGAADKSHQAPEVLAAPYQDTEHGEPGGAYIADVEKPRDSWRSRRVLGLPILTFIVVAVVILLAVVGGVVGGVVGSQAGKSNADDPGDAQDDTAASNNSSAISPTTTSPTSATSGTSSTSSATRTAACPEFSVDARSDYWHIVANDYQNPSLFMSGAYNAADNNSVIKMVTLSADERTPKEEWQFLKIKEPHPLAKLGCADPNLQVTLYKLACRSTEPDVDIRLGIDVDTVAWDRANGGKNTSEEVLRLRLAPDDNGDLSQLWYTRKYEGEGETGEYEWIEMHNYVTGQEWRLASKTNDAQAFLWSKGWDEGRDPENLAWTRWHNNITELIESPWFGY